MDFRSKGGGGGSKSLIVGPLYLDLEDLRVNPAGVGVGGKGGGQKERRRKKSYSLHKEAIACMC